MKKDFIIPLTSNLRVEIPLGGTFTLGMKTYICENDPEQTCSHCAFFRNPSFCQPLPCTASARIDHIDVTFHELTDE